MMKMNFLVCINHGEIPDYIFAGHAGQNRVVVRQKSPRAGLPGRQKITGIISGS
jgi:hypothetical protein